MSGTRFSSQIVGWKVIVFGGDFRQILPVVPRRGRFNIVHANIQTYIQLTLPHNQFYILQN